jgi:hypothetical protein
MKKLKCPNSFDVSWLPNDVHHNVAQRLRKHTAPGQMILLHIVFFEPHCIYLYFYHSHSHSGLFYMLCISYSILCCLQIYQHVLFDCTTAT